MIKFAIRIKITKWQKKVTEFKDIRVYGTQISGIGTSRYITMKNKKNTPDRMELKKFNPILKKMTIHKEIK